MITNYISTMKQKTTIVMTRQLELFTLPGEQLEFDFDE